MPSHHPKVKIAGLGRCVDCGDYCSRRADRCMECTGIAKRGGDDAQLLFRLAHGETQAEIARSFGVSRQAIGQRVRRARAGAQ